MPDLQRMGGPTEFFKAAHLAEAFDVPVSPHLFPEMNLSLLAAIPNASILEYMPWFEPIYRERIELDGEAVPCARAARLGLQLRSGRGPAVADRMRPAIATARICC